MDWACRVWTTWLMMRCAWLSKYSSAQLFASFEMLEWTLGRMNRMLWVGCRWKRSLCSNLVRHDLRLSVHTAGTSAWSVQNWRPLSQTR
ncbi:hypothetical protein IWZ00DRAFT_319535 [Phyllosticta capitalensis]|uniref:uncharacterized protein n=1 Tax=Phyllosticta capitalensis TaxID=121624 RepID=UPI00312D419B